MIFIFMNLDTTKYIRSKYLNKFLLNIWNELKIFTLCNNFFHLPTTSTDQAVE